MCSFGCVGPWCEGVAGAAAATTWLGWVLQLGRQLERQHKLLPVFVFDLPVQL